MIRTLAVTLNHTVEKDIPLVKLSNPEIIWYWVDFIEPTEAEILLLDTHFHFHPLTIEDCTHFLQRPKMDYYEGYHFFVLHAMNQKTLEPEEVDMFIGKNYIVTFHLKAQFEIEEAWVRMCGNSKLWSGGAINCAHLVIDKLVDHFFPVLHQIEDDLLQLENDIKNKSIDLLMEEVYEIRGQLLKVRRSINPMRDLLYRIINSERLAGQKDSLVYFTDIYDHLLKLSDMIESNREITADMRDSYMSINSNRMNKIMKTLTVSTSIFMPLTFIAGVYGMNFDNMPELTWRFGYFGIMIVMSLLGIGMVLWFRRKGWFK
ncbi:magnesium/cobalt transporter CorA [Paenibacillus psychroresistens]|uniref:Magnesium transport protein CorA n=1 Tax=Paenibacillus psychroresistens TaxID=1778678 RepID=A0A6B8RLT8_9BACL|nr:magnesium/cobalt transporter CorA [Paenibacillus psychroresistens]QGQ96396.1 magnesium/cobalt transporter CorA [Paenibacillus psychroresistens]